MVHILGKNTFLDNASLKKMVVLSGILHFSLFLGFVLFPQLSPIKRISAPITYSPVLLISPGELAGGGQSPKPVVIPKARTQVATPKPTLLQKKLEAKPIEIAKTPPAEQKSPPAVKPEKTTRPGDEAKLDEAMKNIRDRVENRAQTAGASGGMGVGANALAGGGIQSPEIAVYLSIVIDRITEAWFLPPGLKDDAVQRGLLTIIDIRIDRDGKVTIQGIEQRSGNAVFDEHALKAINTVQAHSFPPLPAVYREPYLELGIRFNPAEGHS